MALPKPAPVRLRVCEDSTVWRVPLEGVGTYDVRLELHSDLLIVEDAVAGRRLNDAKMRQILPIIRQRIADASRR